MALWWLVLMTQWNAKLTTIKTMQDVWPSKHTLLVLRVPKKICLSPQVQNSWRRFYLEKGSQTRWSWIWGRDPQSHNKHPYKKRRGHGSEEGDVKREAEIGGMHLQTKGHQGMLETTREAGSPSGASKSNQTAYTLISDYWSPELWKNQFLFY